MFGMSFGEILIIAVIAILFIGPDKLPEAMIKVAKFFKSFKSTINETKETIEQELHLAELKDEARHYKEKLDNAVNDYKLDDINIIDDLKDSAKEIENSVTDIATTPKVKKPKKEKKQKKNKDSDV